MNDQSLTVSRRMRCIAVVGLVTFIGDAARGLLFPALLPLSDKLGEHPMILCPPVHAHVLIVLLSGGNQVILGLLVAMFSLGRVVISTRLGIMADQHGHRYSLLVAGGVFILGSLLWANSLFLGGMAMLFIAQFTLGLGTGSLGVTRAYIVEQTESIQRTYMLARLSALQYAGFCVTPLLGSVFVVAGSAISSYAKYALPAYFLFLCAAITFALLWFVFEDLDDEPTTTRRSSLTGRKSSVTAYPAELFDLDIEQTNVEDEKGVEMKAFPTPNASEEGCDVERGSPCGPTDIVEPSSEEPGQVVNPMAPTDTALAQEVGQASKSDISASALDEHHVLLHRVYNLMLFLNFSTRGVLSIMETQSSPALLDQYNFSELALGALVSTAGATGTVQLLFFKQLWVANFSDYTLMLGGCVFLFFAQMFAVTWGSTDSNSPGRFITALYLIYGFGYPVANSAALGIFSILQKNGKQSESQGRFALAGSLARVICPVISGFCEQYIGQGSSFGFAMFLMAITVVGILVVQPEKLLYPTGGKQSTAPL